ncbi:MAG: hypothetical protein OFPI_17930 [Osedax symbiont Rs2]|nr:MAG: hypothetical protein OFPI_17930 [Osedax symbiont Rs2]
MVNPSPPFVMFEVFDIICQFCSCDRYLKQLKKSHTSNSLQKDHYARAALVE